MLMISYHIYSINMILISYYFNCLYDIILE